MAEEVEIYTRINNGEYENKNPFSISKCRSKELRDREYKEYSQEKSRLRAKFFVDLAAYYDVPANDPFVKVMNDLAWEQGHANGYGEVAGYFGELMRLWKLYAAK